LRIELKDRRWWISLKDHKVAGDRDPAQGEGDTFAEAWHNIQPHWAGVKAERSVPLKSWVRVPPFVIC